MGTALPLGVAGLVLVVAYAFASPGWLDRPFTIVQGLLLGAVALYLIWMGWNWRKRPT